jgi:holin-like protein
MKHLKPFFGYQNIPGAIRGLLVIFAFLFLGEMVSRIPDFPIPGNVTGMILIFLALQTGMVRLQWVKMGSDLLLKNMALFFVPPGVGIMLYFELIGKYWPAIVTSTLVSTLLVMWITGYLAQKINKIRHG